jgi:cephalosporin hydroxylase
MRLTIDTETGTLTYEESGRVETLSLYSKASFEMISAQWLKVGWNQKYTYAFSWLGRPVIQLPDDLIRMQEVVYRVKPDVIVETGVAHGGSILFYASLCKVMGKGRVIGVDIDVRPHNRHALEAHELFPLITLVEGNSVDPEVVSRVKTLVRRGESALVVLDSNHSYQHVSAELEAYHELVMAGSYIVATDGIMRHLHDVPRGRIEWAWDNPAAAAVDFVARHPEFSVEQPAWLFNESDLSQNVTHWPEAWLRRR